MMARAKELAEQPRHYATDQFNNPYIIPGHRESLGREIWEQTAGHVTAFKHGHRHRHLIDGSLRRPETPRCLHRSARTGRFRSTHRRRAERRHAGLGGFVVPQWDPEKVDHVEAIGDDEALEMMLRLIRDDGVFAGISTGANVVGAHRLAERLGPDAVIVTLAVDTAFKYLSVSPLAEL